MQVELKLASQRLAASGRLRPHELRATLKEWRKVLPEDHSGVTATLRGMMRDLLKKHPELRDASRLSRNGRRRPFR